MKKLIAYPRKTVILASRKI